MVEQTQITKPYFSAEQQSAISAGIANILKSGRLINGPYTQELEQQFAAQTGTRYAIAVNTCTTALHICLKYFGAEGADILVPAASFTTDVSAVRWGGAKPILVDIDPDTLSFDLSDLKRKISKRTKGVIWLHLTGLIASNHEELLAFFREHSLFVIEDCAHAQGARVGGKLVGSLADAGCFSFFATKLMTCGVGGMMTTNDAKLDSFAREIRFFGRNVERGEVASEGNDWLMDEFRACIALAQLNGFDAMFARRQAVAERYRLALANQPGIKLLDAPDNSVHAYYQFAVLLRDRAMAAQVGKALNEKHGIQAKRIYLPVHQEKIFREYDVGGLEQAEDAMHRSLCLPMHASLGDEEADRIGAALVAEVRSRL